MVFDKCTYQFTFVSMQSSKINILIAEDQIVYSDGIRYHLEQDDRYNFLGSYPNAEELIHSEFIDQGDVILMDINMPVMNGIDGTKYLHKNYPHIKVLMLSMYGNQELIFQIIRAGAKGYLYKNTSKAEIDEAINTIIGGRVFFDKKLIDHSWGERENTIKVTNNKNFILTRREKQIIRRLGLKSPAAISLELGLNLKLVYLYIQNMYRKFNVNNRDELKEIASRLELNYK